MKVGKIALVVLLPFAITACGSVKSSKHYSRSHKGPYSPRYGEFKVGDSYEVQGKTYHPEYDESYNETGVASWYGPGFHGNSTANGAQFDKYDMTAAHKTLPMPSMARVTNMDNGKTIDVVINDRGPFVEGRIIDLSKKAAEQIGMIGTGTANVRVQFLKRESEQLWASLGMLPEAKQYAKGSIKDAEVQTYAAAPVASVAPVQVASSGTYYEASKEDASSIVSVVSTSDSASKTQEMPEIKVAEVKSAPLRYDSIDKVVARAENSGDAQVISSKDSPTQSQAKKVASITEIIETNINPISSAVAAEPERNSFKAAALPEKLPETREVATLEKPVGKSAFKSGITNLKQKFVQAGAFGVQENAFKAANQLSEFGPANVEPVFVQDKKLYRVKLGPFEKEEEIGRVLKKVISSGLADAKVVLQ